MSKNAVGPKVREARNRAGMRVSQAELAARLQAAGIDLDPSAISRIENQDRLVSDLEILAICKALEVQVEWLFEGLDRR